MGNTLKLTLSYLKKIKQEKKSILFIFLWGLIFEIAWIIPGFDLLSLISPIINPVKSYLTSPLLGLLFIRTYNPHLMFIWVFVIAFIISAITSTIYIFIHCKAYNILVKKILNFKSDVDIKDLYVEKSDNLKQYFYWEISCFFIKFFIFVPFFIWSNFFADFSNRIEHILIFIVVCILFIIVDLYTIVTRVFVAPVFISDKYQDLKSIGIWNISTRICSAKLIVPSLVLAIVYILSNILVLVGFVFLFAIKEYFEIIWVFNIILWILFIFIASCFAYHVGLFCFVYSCSCQELIFPDNPLILHSESEDGQIEDVYSVFEEEDFYEK